MPAQTTDIHRMLIQSLISRRHVPEDVAVELYKRCLKAYKAIDRHHVSRRQADPTTTREIVKECSQLLEEQDLRLEIRAVADEARYGKVIYVLVNTDGSDDSRGMTDYEPLQISYFRLLVENIVESYPANSIGSNIALNLSSQLKSPITKSNAGSLLSSFVARGWLSKSKRGRYTLGARGIAELEPWLKAGFEDYVRNCGRCAGVVLSGIICSYPDCESHIHGSCHALLSSAARPKCPSCRNTFADYPPAPLGEKAVSVAEDTFSKNKGKRKRPSAINGTAHGRGDEEDEDEGSGAEEEDDTNGMDEGAIEGRTRNARNARSRIRRGQGQEGIKPEPEEEDFDFDALEEE